MITSKYGKTTFIHNSDLGGELFVVDNSHSEINEGKDFEVCVESEMVVDFVLDKLLETYEETVEGVIDSMKNSEPDVDTAYQQRMLKQCTDMICALTTAKADFHKGYIDIKK